jgi:hypothetical protein
MQYINRPITLEHQAANCNRVPRISPGKPEANSDIQRNNVITFVAASKPARHIEDINFKYPMLECS